MNILTDENSDVRIPDYKLLERCGRGAYGEVWIAEDYAGRKVALKIVEKSTQIEKEFTGLRNYAKIAPGPHLIRIFHIGESDSLLYYTMELADDLNRGHGPYLPATLGNILSGGKRIPPSEIRTFAMQILAGLKNLHESNLIHRDIKPENILFVNGQAKLSDIGLIRPLNETLSFAGTLGFIPPERIKNGAGVKNSSDDLYALGKVLYCMLSGNPPEKYPSIPGDMIGSPEVKLLNTVILTACSRNAPVRFRNTEDFSRALTNGIPARKKTLAMLFHARYFIGAAGLAAGCGLLFSLIPEKRDASEKESKNIAWYASSPAENSQLQKERKTTEISEIGSFYHPGNANNALREFYPHPSANEMPTPEKLAADAETYSRLEIKKFLDKIAAAGPALRLQMESVLGKTETDAFFEKTKNVESLSPQNGFLAVGELTRILKKASVNKLPGNTKPPENFTDAMNRFGEMFIMTDSPLADFLPDDRKTALKKDLSAWANKYLNKNLQIRPGENWKDDTIGYVEFNFIPPGEFISPRTKKHERIEYPFWAGTSEVKAGEFSRICGFLPLKSRDLAKPVELISWNDALLYCRKFTLVLREKNLLPPGYIARLPTEAEWEWCALGGWRGGSAPPDDAKPNALGLFKEAAIWELTLPYPGTKLTPNAVWMRRGKVKSEKIPVTSASNFLWYQTFAPDVSFRCVIAPGDMSYFDENFHTGDPCHLVFGNRHFELIGGNIASYEKKGAQEICRLLGGRLAVVDSPELAKKLYETFFYIDTFYTIVDAEFKNGAWRWPDGRELGPSAPKTQGEKNQNLYLLGTGFHFFTGRVPVFLCEWTEEEWQNKNQRKNRFDNPAVLARFNLEGTDFILVNFSAIPHVARRMAQLLGLKNASPRNQAFREKLSRKLLPWESEKIMLGGIKKYGTWILPDGDEFIGTLPLVGSRFGLSPGLSAPGFYRGEFCEFQVANYCLFEIPADDGISKANDDIIDPAMKRLTKSRE